MTVAVGCSRSPLPAGGFGGTATLTALPLTALCFPSQMRSSIPASQRTARMQGAGREAVRAHPALANFKECLGGAEPLLPLSILGCDGGCEEGGRGPRSRLMVTEETLRLGWGSSPHLLHAMGMGDASPLWTGPHGFSELSTEEPQHPSPSCLMEALPSLSLVPSWTAEREPASPVHPEGLGRGQEANHGPEEAAAGRDLGAGSRKDTNTRSQQLGSLPWSQVPPLLLP